jgi:hypothetical protein
VRPASLHSEEFVYIDTHIPDSVQTVCELPLPPNNTALKHVYTNRSIAKFSLDIYHWGVGLAVTERIRDIGQNVSQSPIQTGSSSSHSYCQMLLLIAFLEEDFIGNHDNYNNRIINNIYVGFQYIILLLKIPVGLRKNFFENLRLFGHGPQKDPPRKDTSNLSH